MRASFLLVLALAMMVGLGVAVFIKSAGWLRPPAPPVVARHEAPPPPPPPPPLIVVAARNVYAGDALRPGDVKLRYARNGEVALIEKNKHKYLLESMDPCYYRFVTRDTEADTPITRDLLDDLRKPDPLSDRLPAGAQAVNVSVYKPEAAGGLIQVGDWVDVYLTSHVGLTGSKPDAVPAPRTALLAKACQVVAKRNSLWPVFAGVPDDQAIQFTVAANPYRAALIEYGRLVGNVSLIPASQTEKKVFDDRRKMIGDDPSRFLTVAHPDLSSPDHQAELQLVATYTRGGTTVGEEDMMRVFGLAPIVPAPKVAPPPPVTVEYFSGVQRAGTATFATAQSSGTFVPGTPERAEPQRYFFARPPHHPPAGPSKR